MNKKLTGTNIRIPKIFAVLIFTVMGIIMIVLSYIQNRQENSNYDTIEILNEVNAYQAMLEQRLKDTINSITDSSCTNVMITLEGGFENIYEKDSNTQNESLFYSNKENSQKLVKTKNPKISGVMIVCSNIFDAQSIVELKKAAATCLNINENKIYIIGGAITQ